MLAVLLISQCTIYPLCCFGQHHPLPSLFCIEVQYTEGEIPIWAIKELHWELLPPENTMSPLIAIVTVLVCVFTVYIYLIIICYALFFI